MLEGLPGSLDGNINIFLSGSMDGDNFRFVPVSLSAMLIYIYSGGCYRDDIRRTDRGELVTRLSSNKLIVNKQTDGLRVLASIWSRQRELEVSHDARAVE